MGWNTITNDSLEAAFDVLMEASHVLLQRTDVTLPEVKVLRVFCGSILSEYETMGALKYRNVMQELYDVIILREMQLQKIYDKANQPAKLESKNTLVTTDSQLISQLQRLKSARFSTLGKTIPSASRSVQASRAYGTKQSMDIAARAGQKTLQTNDPELLKAYERLRKAKK